MNTYNGKGWTPGKAMEAAFLELLSDRGDRNGVSVISFNRSIMGRWYCVLVVNFRNV